MLVKTQWIKKRLTKISILLFALLSAAGCQLTSLYSSATQQDIQQRHDTYANYYLWIKNLTDEELLAEVSQQNSNMAANYPQSKLHLVLLYALPNSPIHNPYTAKTLLNQLSQSNQQNSNTDQHMDMKTNNANTNFAFISLLKDQLNQQILTANKLIITKQKLQEIEISSEQTIHKQNVEVAKLKQQIAQLKKIELTIAN